MSLLVDCLRLPHARHDEAIARAASISDTLCVRGWRAPERNLDIPVTVLVRLVPHGPDMAYCRAGGIEGVVARALRMPCSSWRVVSRTSLLWGAARELVVQRFSPEPVQDAAEKNNDTVFFS